MSPPLASFSTLIIISLSDYPLLHNMSSSSRDSLIWFQIHPPISLLKISQDFFDRKSGRVVSSVWHKVKPKLLCCLEWSLNIRCNLICATKKRALPSLSLSSPPSRLILLNRASGSQHEILLLPLILYIRDPGHFRSTRGDQKGDLNQIIHQEEEMKKKKIKSVAWVIIDLHRVEQKSWLEPDITYFQFERVPRIQLTWTEVMFGCSTV